MKLSWVKTAESSKAEKSHECSRSSKFYLKFCKVQVNKQTDKQVWSAQPATLSSQQNFVLLLRHPFQSKDSSPTPKADIVIL